MVRRARQIAGLRVLAAYIYSMSLPVPALAGDSCASDMRPENAQNGQADEPLIIEHTSFGGIVVTNQMQADEAKVAGEIARDRALRYLGLQVPPFLIAAKNVQALPDSSSCAFVMRWPLISPEHGYPKLPSDILPHEIGHQIFIQFLMPTTGKDEHGGSAPDWLDEMAAIAFEDDRGIEDRRAAARLLAKSNALIPLSELLSMTHPEWQPAALNKDPPVWGVPMQPRSLRTFHFYSTVRALLDFLIERTGKEKVISDLAKHIRSEKDVKDWFEQNISENGSKFKFDEIDAELRQFVLTSEIYRDADLFAESLAHEK